MTLRVDARTRAQWDALVCELKIARSGRTDVLAERLEVTAGTVVDWEAGRDMPTMFHLITWAHEVGFVLRVTERGGAPVRYQPYEPDVRDAWEVREMRGLALALHAVRLTERRSQGDVAAQGADDAVSPAAREPDRALNSVGLL